MVLKVGGIAPLGTILRDKGAKTLNHYHYAIIELTSAVTLTLSKLRNRMLIHKRGDLRLYLTKMSPNILKFWGSRQAHPSHGTGNYGIYRFL